MQTESEEKEIGLKKEHNELLNEILKLYAKSIVRLADHEAEMKIIMYMSSSRLEKFIDEEWKEKTGWK